MYSEIHAKLYKDAWAAPNYLIYLGSYLYPDAAAPKAWITLAVKKHLNFW